MKTGLKTPKKICKNHLIFRMKKSTSSRRRKFLVFLRFLQVLPEQKSDKEKRLAVGIFLTRHGGKL